MVLVRDSLVDGSLPSLTGRSDKPLAPVVRKPINANPRLIRPNPGSKYILRLNSVPRRPISTIQGLN